MAIYNYQNNAQKNSILARPTSRTREELQFSITGSAPIIQIVEHYGVKTLEQLKEACKKETLKEHDQRLNLLQSASEGASSNFNFKTVITNTPYDVAHMLKKDSAGKNTGKTDRMKDLDKNPQKHPLFDDLKNNPRKTL